MKENSVLNISITLCCALFFLKNCLSVLKFKILLICKGFEHSKYSAYMLYEGNDGNIQPQINGLLPTAVGSILPIALNTNSYASSFRNALPNFPRHPAINYWSHLQSALLVGGAGGGPPRPAHPPTVALCCCCVVQPGPVIS